MKTVTLAELASDIGATCPDHGEELATSIVTDTRKIKPGSVFIAIKGERVDGARLAHAALEAGAVAVVTNSPDLALASGAAEDRLLCVPDPVRALGEAARASLARLRVENPDLRVIAITGSVGKTTTKDLLARIFLERGTVVAPSGSFNNEVGLPLTVLRADEETATLILEMGADHIGNISYLTSIAPPDLGVVLIVARAHLGEFGGIENVARAKAEIVETVRPGGLVILNADDERVAAMAGQAHAPVRYFSPTGRPVAKAGQLEVWASDVTHKEGHAIFTLHGSGGQSRRVRLALVGEHHVANAVAAACVGLTSGISFSCVVDVLEKATAASPHRMDVYTQGDLTVIDDSYNANPDSMRAGIRGLASLGAGKRKIAVLGSMLELGEESASEHADLLLPLREAGVSLLITVGKEAAALARAARARGEGITHSGQETQEMIIVEALDWEDALSALRAAITPGDVILLKGSHGSHVWRIADALDERGK